MSRRDIETVCTLAAHLALADVTGGNPAAAHPHAKEYAADALKLQKLGWRWQRMEKKKDAARGKGEDGGNIPKVAEAEYNAEASRIGQLVRDTLRSYGLARVRLGGHWTESCICIRDLPGNMPDRPADGFYI